MKILSVLILVLIPNLAVASSIVEYVEKAKSDRLMPLAGHIFALLTSFDSGVEGVSVNKICKLPCVSVYIADGAKIRDESELGLTTVANNAVFIPPNIIVFDEFFLARAFSKQRTLDIEGNFAARRDFFSWRMDTFPGLLQDDTIIAVRDLEYDNDLEVVRRTGRPYTFANEENVVSWMERLSQQASDLSDINNLDFMVRTSFGIAFVYFHELGHLRANNISGFESIDEFLDYFLFQSKIDKAKESEVDADRHAADIFANLWESELGGIYRNVINMTFESQVEEMQRDLYRRVFDGFRGKSFTENVAFMKHIECEQYENFIGGLVEKLENDEDTFSDLLFVDMARRDVVPLISQREFDYLSDIARKMQRSTHADPVFRLRAFAEAIASRGLIGDEGKKVAEITKRETRFLSALLEARPVDVSPDISRSAAGYTSIDEMVAVLSAFVDGLPSTSETAASVAYSMTIEDAVNCPDRKCAILRFGRKNEPERIVAELIEGSTGIDGMSLTFRNGLIDLNLETVDYISSLIERLIVTEIIKRVVNVGEEEVFRALHKLLMVERCCEGTGATIKNGLGQFVHIGNASSQLYKAILQ